MKAMEGTTKLLLPKITRHIAEITIPIMDAACRFSFIHYSIKITTNMAVITKSSPFVLNDTHVPKIPPNATPVTQ